MIPERGGRPASARLSIPQLTPWHVWSFFLTFPPGLRKRRMLLCIHLHRRSRQLKRVDNVNSVYDRTRACIHRFFGAPVLLFFFKKKFHLFKEAVAKTLNIIVFPSYRHLIINIVSTCSLWPPSQSHERHMITKPRCLEYVLSG